MSLLEHELGDVAEVSAAASTRSNCGIHYSVSGKVKFSCFVTNRFLAKVHIVFVPQWSASCVNVEDCNHHIPYILESNPHPFYSLRAKKSDAD